VGDGATTAPPLTTTSSSSSSSRASEKLPGSGFLFAPMPVPRPVLEPSSWASSSSAAVRAGERRGVWAAEEERLGAACMRACGVSMGPFVLCACGYGVNPTQQSKARAGGERGRHEETEKRTGGSWACSWRRFNTIVEVDERLEFLERERLRRLIVNEYTLPFLRRLLVALEYYHFIVLYKDGISISAVGRGRTEKGEGSKRKCVSGGGETETNVDCGSLNPNRGYFLARVHLECAWLGRIYRCRLVIICERGM
jgi:hypothetical protein